MICKTIKGTNGSNITHCYTKEYAPKAETHEKKFKKRQDGEESKQWCLKAKGNKGGKREEWHPDTALSMAKHEQE